jgi:hypothetical protein
LASKQDTLRDVTKTSTYRLHTFRTRDLGVLGYVDANRVAFYRAPLRRHTADSEFDSRRHRRPWHILGSCLESDDAESRPQRRIGTAVCRKLLIATRRNREAL